MKSYEIQLRNYRCYGPAICVAIATRRMTRARLDELDPDGEVLGWFGRIHTMMQRFDATL